MYTRISRSGGRAYLQIVEGYRSPEGKVRQRVIANLMRVDAIEPGALDSLIRGLQRAAGQTPAEAPTRAAQAEFAPARAFGHLFALHQIWQQLGLGDALARCFRSSRRRFDAEALVRAMVFNRLVAPRSKLGLLEWLDTVTMPECPAMTHQQLLRAMDALIVHLDAVEAAVCRQVRPLLDSALSVVFYDLTTIRYSGEESAGDWPLVSKGLSKDTGQVERQFVLGVVQSGCGLPLLHTVAPGNVGETRTVEAMLAHVLKRFPVKQMVLVADRGLLSLDNLDAITAIGAQHQVQVDFVMALPARRYGEMKGVNQTLVFENGLAEGEFAGRRLVVSFDAGRAAEQKTARLAKLQAAEALGERLARKLDGQDVGDNEPGRRATDRGAYKRFAQELRDRKLSRFFRLDWKAELFSYTREDQAIAAAEAFDGKLYVLTSLPKDAFPAAAVIERYKSLADIERGFRVLKSELLIAPVHHRLETRIRAHALICFLALLLHRVMRQRLKQNQATQSPASALRLLEQIQHHQVTVEGKAFQGITRHTPEQRELFDLLRIEQPA